MGEMVISLIEYICDVAFGGQNLQSVGLNIKKFSAALTSNSANAVTFKNVYTSISVVAIAILTLYLVIELINMYSNSSVSLESFVSVLLRALVGYLFITNGYTLIILFSDLSYSLILHMIPENTVRFANSAYLADGSKAELMFRAIKLYILDANELVSIGPLLKVIIPAIAIFIANLVLYLVILSRMLEFIARIAFAPIALAGSFIGGVNDKAIRYLKKTACAALQSIIILMIVWAGTRISIEAAQIDGGPMSGYAKAIDNANEMADVVSDTKTKNILQSTGDLIATLASEASGIVFGEKGQKNVVKGINFVFGIFGGNKFDEESMMFLRPVDEIGKSSLDTILSSNVLIYISAMQVGITLMAFASQKLAEDMIL